MSGGLIERGPLVLAVEFFVPGAISKPEQPVTLRLSVPVVLIEAGSREEHDSRGIAGVRYRYVVEVKGP